MAIYIPPSDPNREETSDRPNNQNGLGKGGVDTSFPSKESPNDSVEIVDQGNIRFIRSVYSNSDFRKKVNTEFNEIKKDNRVNLKQFFDMYSSVFFSIPKEGTNSHSSIITRSTEYVENYVSPKDQIIKDLEKIIEDLELKLAEGDNENILYKNGTLIKDPLDRLHYMDKGYRRLVVWSGPEFHNSLKIALYGTTDPELPKVSSGIFERIPIGPNLTEANFAQPFEPNEVTDTISDILLELDPQDIAYIARNYNTIEEFRSAVEEDLVEKRAVIDALNNKINSVNNQINAILASDPDYIPPASDDLPASNNIGGSRDGNTIYR